MRFVIRRLIVKGKNLDVQESVRRYAERKLRRVERVVEEPTDAIVELSALIAFQNMSSKFNAALAVPPQGFCRLPDQPRKDER